MTRQTLSGFEKRLNTQEIAPEQAQQLRHNLTSFAEEWNSPEMSIYDDYDAAKLTILEKT